MRTASVHPQGAAPQCRQPPGRFIPVIDRNRCEGKGPCVPACPYDVLEMGRIGPQEKSTLNLVGRLKAFAHGGKQVFVTDPDQCRACGECVKVCPEHAITLARAPGPLG
jgi:NAD-dependent dihydropyrimidine dehydrogenase PreA subunit